MFETWKQALSGKKRTLACCFVLSFALCSCQNPRAPQALVTTKTPVAMPAPKREISPTPKPKLARPEPDTALERQVLYHPSRELSDERPGFVEELVLRTSDEINLRAWYLAPPQDRPLLLYFHGNGGNLSSLAGLFETFQTMQVGAFAVDHRGYGMSEGDPSEQGLYLDGQAAYDRALKLCPDAKIVVFGRSLGGGVATRVAQDNPCAALILESSFTSATEVARHSHGDEGARLVRAFDSLSRAKDIRVPVFLLHGTQDTTIPFFMSQELQESFPSSELWSVSGAGHNNLRRVAGEHVYQDRLNEFLASLP